MKLFLYYIGKPRDAHANAIAGEYLKRSMRYADCQMREIRYSTAHKGHQRAKAKTACALPHRFDLFAKHPSARKIFLDPAGRAMSSAQFTEAIALAERSSQDLVFLVGGHDGLPPEWISRADLLLSLSPMTYPHELARVMLAEQIYRAFTTLRGHPYPR